jgi:AcrR family transcriptional regulator
MEAGDRRSLGVGTGRPSLARSPAREPVYLSHMSEPRRAKRPYRMQARAEAAAATRERILEASEAAFDELPYDRITLAEVARRAGVAVQTVLRHFESRDGLSLAVLVHLSEKMAGDRDVPPGASVEEVIDVLVDHYERFGDKVLRTLSQEDSVPTLRTLTDFGRTYHLEWCRQAFAPALKGLRGARRERRVCQLVALTDIYVWKVLRRDRGLSPEQTKLAIREMIDSLTERGR